MSAAGVFCSSAVSPLERKNHGNIYDTEYSVVNTQVRKPPGLGFLSALRLTMLLTLELPLLWC